MTSLKMAPHPTRIGPVAVPPLAIGTMYFGTRVPTEVAHRCLDRAADLGAAFFDTANNYAFWAGGIGDESETCIGAWWSRRGAAVRDRTVLATKVGARPAAPGLGLESALGLSAAAIRAQVTDSLRRLRTDRVDVLYAHVDDPAVPLDETLGAMSGLVDEGLARAIAASNLTAPRLREAAGTRSRHRYAALQQRFTFLTPSPDEDLAPHVLLDEEVAALCRKEEITMLGYSPLLSGAYTRPNRTFPDAYKTAARRRALSTLQDVARSYDLDAGQAVIAWMVQRPDPVLPVVGVSTPEQVTSAHRAANTRLRADAVDALEEARRG